MYTSFVSLCRLCAAQISRRRLPRGCRLPMAPVASFMVTQNWAATLYRRRNPNESRRNRNKGLVSARAKSPRNYPNKRHLLG